MKIVRDLLIWGITAAFLAWCAQLFEAELAFQKGRKAHDSGQTAAARSYLERAVEKSPANCQYHRALAQVLFQKPPTGSRSALDLDRAWQEQSKAITSCPRYPYYWFEAALSLSAIEDQKGTAPENPNSYFEQALTIDPRNPRFISGKIYALLRMGQRPEAQKLFYELAAISPESIKVFAPTILKEPGEIEDFIAAIKNSPAALSALVLYLAENGDLDRAREVYTLLPVEYQRDPAFALRLVIYYLHDNQDEVAEQVLISALLSHPAEARLSMKLGLLEFNEHNYEKAVAYLQPAVQAHPDAISLLLMLGRSARKIGDNELALSSYAKALSLKNLSPVNFKECHSARGEIKYEMGDLQGALNEYTIIVNHNLADEKVFRRIQEIKEEQWKRQKEPRQDSP